MFKDNKPTSNACASHNTNNHAKKRTKKGAAKMLGLRVLTIVMTVSMVLSGDGVAHGTRALAQTLSESANEQADGNAASTSIGEESQEAVAHDDDPPPGDPEENENDQPSDNNGAGDDVQTPDDVEPQDAYEPQPAPEAQDAYEPSDNYGPQYTDVTQDNSDSQFADVPQDNTDPQADPAELPVDEPASDEPAAPVHNTLYGNVPVYLSFSMDGQQAEPRAVTVKLQLRMQTWDPAANAWSPIDEAGDNAGWADVLDEATGRPVTAHLDREAISQNVNASYADDDPTNDGAAFTFANQIVQTVLEDGTCDARYEYRAVVSSVDSAIEGETDDNAYLDSIDGAARTQTFKVYAADTIEKTADFTVTSSTEATLRAEGDAPEWEKAAVSGHVTLIDGTTIPPVDSGEPADESDAGENPADPGENPDQPGDNSEDGGSAENPGDDQDPTDNEDATKGENGVPESHSIDIATDTKLTIRPDGKAVVDTSSIQSKDSEAGPTVQASKATNEQPELKKVIAQFSGISAPRRSSAKNANANEPGCLVVTKEWVGDENYVSSIRPESLSMSLYKTYDQGGGIMSQKEKVQEFTLSDAGGNWSYVFQNLGKR